MDKYINFARKLALAAGEIMTENFGIEGKEKSDKSLLTVADLKINQLVIDEINKAFPDHSIKAEEGSSVVDSDYLWVCDPIDGTRSFSFGVPVNVFSIALLKNGVVMLGVVYDPYLKRMYYAIQGKGAFMNDKRIIVSAKNCISEGCIDICYFNRAKYNLSGFVQFMSDKGIKVTNIGLSSIIYAGMLVANGKLEVGIFPNTTAHDCSSIKIIVEEAGGKVTDIKGNDQKYDQDINGCIFSNGFVHAEVLGFIKEYGI